MTVDYAAIIARKRKEYKLPEPEPVYYERPPLAEFARQAWHVLEPSTKYVHNWHIDVICKHLEAVSRGDIIRLIINVPPGTMKSLLTCVIWPAWDWIENPGRRFLTGSYASDLAIRDSLKSRTLINSEWFQSQWGDRFQLSGDQNAKRRYRNDKMGERITTHVGGSTGERGDIRILDDPHNMFTVQSDTVRMSDLEWIKTVWPSRTVDPNHPAEVLIMQRLHERDISGYYIDELGDYERLMLPMRYEPERAAETSLGKVDPRTQPGELLFPGRYDEAAVQKLEFTLGGYGSSGQLQQSPAPASGNIFKRHWWCYWQPAGENLPPVTVENEHGEMIECPLVELPGNFESVSQSWDMTFKGKEESSFVCGQAWGKLGANAFLLAQKREKLTFIGTLAAFREMSRDFPQTSAKYIEDKANGPAIISSLQSEISGIIPVNPQGDKVARARAVSPFMEAHNVYIPHPNIAHWVGPYINEFAMFPNSTYNDQVDTTSQELSNIMMSNDIDIVNIGAYMRG
jgi:predicted phage terminase large subunit-like protein